MDLFVVPLHKFKQHTDQCCKLINDEWKRSDAARMRSLESSSDKLPTNLILLHEDRVIGHAKLSPIPSINDACFVESVVIESSLRGKGFGTILMKQAEEYCKTYLHLKTIYLSTKGQEQFYRKLGYIECQPISIYGSYTSTLSTFNNKFNSKKVHSDLKVEAPRPPPMPIINGFNHKLKTYMKKDID